MTVSSQAWLWPRRVGLSLACGLFVGSATAAFLASLNWVTDFRTTHPGIMWLLPLGGLGIGWMYHHFRSRGNSGVTAVLEEINSPTTPLPTRMAPMILGGTLLTHLVGGSAGREGTAVQMAAAISDQLCRVIPLSGSERRRLLIAGAGAGFGAAIGAPIAGAIFGMEFRQVGKFEPIAIVDSIIASGIATVTVGWWGIHHTPYPRFAGHFQFKHLIITATLAVAFGLAARFFVAISHGVQWISKRMIQWPPLRPLVGGTLLAVVMTSGHRSEYAGLGIPTILHALNDPSPWVTPIIKVGLTALTIGTGFKGGEFMPLVFVGATLGSAMGSLIPGMVPILSRTGFAAVFGAAANTPLACTIMAVELFGISFAPYAFVGCFFAYFAAGNKGIYGGQYRTSSKFWFILRTPNG